MTKGRKCKKVGKEKKTNILTIVIANKTTPEHTISKLFIVTAYATANLSIARI